MAKKEIIDAASNMIKESNSTASENTNDATNAEDAKVSANAHIADAKNHAPVKKSFWNKVWNFICAPCRFICKILKKIWFFICSINIVGLLNLTLLSSIIVLFSILIMDITKCKTDPVATPDNSIITKSHTTEIKEKVQEVKDINATDKEIIKTALTLPLKKELVRSVKSDTIKETVQTMYGDTIIDGMFPDTKISNGTQISGNVYLQNMRRYTLPCNIQINGDLFLRNVGMLKFCGSFTITGNIYVTPNSSFGAIPANARLGGQVIL